jgi:hypothetical protein
MQNSNRWVLRFNFATAFFTLHFPFYDFAQGGIMGGPSLAEEDNDEGATILSPSP